MEHNLQDTPEIRRLIISCGGVPRILDFLAEELNNCSGVYQVPTILKNLETNLESWYKIKTNVKSNFGTAEQVKEIIAISLTRQEINLENISPVDGLTWENLMIRGSVYIFQNRIIFPPIVASMLSDALYLFDIDLLEPVKKDWNWKRFESAEPIIDAVKTNIFASAGFKEIEISKFYGDLCSPGLIGKKMSLQKVEVANETHQFLPVNKIRATVVESEVGNFMKNDEKLFEYSFLCHTGNPGVDSRIFRKSSLDDTIKTPWMICKQTKHTIDNITSLTELYLEEQYRQWRGLKIPLQENFRAPFVLFSNRNCTESDIRKFLNNHTGAIVICKANLNLYLPTVLSCFMDMDEEKTILSENFKKETIKFLEDDEHNDNDSSSSEQSEYSEGSDKGDRTVNLKSVRVTKKRKTEEEE